MIWYNRDQDESQLSMRRGLCQARIILVFRSFWENVWKYFYSFLIFPSPWIEAGNSQFSAYENPPAEIIALAFYPPKLDKLGPAAAAGANQEGQLINFFFIYIFSGKKLLVFLSSCHYFCLSHSSLFANCYTPIDSFSLF